MSHPKVYLVTVTTVVPVVAVSVKDATTFAGQLADSPLSCIWESYSTVVLEDSAALRRVTGTGSTQWNITDDAYESSAVAKTPLTMNSTWMQFLFEKTERFFKGKKKTQAP